MTALLQSRTGAQYLICQAVEAERVELLKQYTQGMRNRGRQWRDGNRLKRAVE